MKEHDHPISQASEQAVADQACPSRGRRRSKRNPGLRKPELNLTSMIDVVFLLLVFFVVTANFTIDEGTLLAKLPGNSKSGPTPPPPVLVKVDLNSSDDGMTYSTLDDGVAVQSASDLAAYLSNRVQAGKMASDDLVQINPQGVVRWQHVLNVYNACVSAELTQVTFASR